MSIPGHEPDCIGYEDCQCFHVTLGKEKYAALLDVVDAIKAYLPINDSARWDRIDEKPPLTALCNARQRLNEALAKLDQVKR